MKVYIGPYRHHWTTQSAERLWYKLRYKKYDWEVENPDKLDKAVERVLDAWRVVVCRPVNWIKNRIPRTTIVKIDHYDDWSADHTMALIIHPLLKQMKESKHGAPYTDDEDVPEHLRSTAAPPKENEWDTDENHFKRWDWIMDEMIWTFEQLASDDDESQFYHGESDILLQGVDADGNAIGTPRKLGEKGDENASLYQLINGPGHTFYVDRAGLDAHNERISKGLRLFGKYYRGLWT
jgi:hypothetical protein